jgi:hypothetical protein
MRIRKHPLLAAVLLAGTASAQSQLEWLIHFDMASGVEAALACGVDAPGNVFVAATASHVWPEAEPDCILSKVSPSGALLWTRQVGTRRSAEFATSLLVDSTGVSYVGGLLEAAGSLDRWAVVRVDPDGSVRWRQPLPAGGTGELHALAFMREDGIVAAGTEWLGAGVDGCIAAYARDGQVLWKRSVDGTKHGKDEFRDIVVAPDGAIYAAGYCNGSSTGLELGLARISSSGELQWLWEYTPTPGVGFNILRKLALAANGDIVAGGKLKAAQDDDVVVARLSPDGRLLWLSTYDSGANDALEDLQVDDGSDTVWILTKSPDLKQETAVVRFDGAGKQLSVTPLSSAGQAPIPARIVLGGAGQAYVSMSYAFAYVAQIDSQGVLNWLQPYSSGMAWDRVHGACAARDDRLVLVGSSGDANHTELFVARIDLNESPQAYCEAKTSSLGCTPHLAFTGLSSASAASGFEVRAEPMINMAIGMFVYGLSGPASSPFGGGVLCIQPPLLRTPVQATGGTAGLADCSGRIALDWNAFAKGSLGGNPDPGLLIPGTVVCCQAWGRDPGFAPPFDRMLSNAIRYVVLP